MSNLIDPVLWKRACHESDVMRPPPSREESLCTIDCPPCNKYRELLAGKEIFGPGKSISGVALGALVQDYDNAVEGAIMMRGFGTGATRTADASRYDPEGFLSPLVLERFCEYMNRHRVQADSRVRDSDNWQKGMPRESYIKGLLRHTLHAWTRLRGHIVRDDKAAANLEEDLCAMLFNTQGLLLEILLGRDIAKNIQPEGEKTI